MLVRALMTIQGKRETFSPKSTFSLEDRKEIDRLLEIGAIEMAEDAPAPDGARLLQVPAPPPKFPERIQDGDAVVQPIVVKESSEPEQDKKKSKKK